MGDGAPNDASRFTDEKSPLYGFKGITKVRVVLDTAPGVNIVVSNDEAGNNEGDYGPRGVGIYPEAGWSYKSDLYEIRSLMQTLAHVQETLLRDRPAKVDFSKAIKQIDALLVGAWEEWKRER